MFVSEIKSIVEAAGISFLYGNSSEINMILSRVDKFPVLIYFTTITANDTIQNNNLVTTTFPFNAALLTKRIDSTVDYESEIVQTEIDQMRDKARNIIYRINNSEIIRIGSEGITEVSYPSLYGQNDEHLFGVGIECTIPADTGLTYCE